MCGTEAAKVRPRAWSSPGAAFLSWGTLGPRTSGVPGVQQPEFFPELGGEQGWEEPSPKLRPLLPAEQVSTANDSGRARTGGQHTVGAQYKLNDQWLRWLFQYLAPFQRRPQNSLPAQLSKVSPDSGLTKLKLFNIGIQSLMQKEEKTPEASGTALPILSSLPKAQEQHSAGGADGPQKEPGIPTTFLSVLGVQLALTSSPPFKIPGISGTPAHPLPPYSSPMGD